ARAAALRGHAVELFEAGPALGGQMLGALKPARARKTLDHLRDYLVREVERLGVEVRLKTRWSTERLAEDAPDALVLASGARPAPPTLPGAWDPRVVQAVDLLAGAAPAVAGDTVTVVIGGGLVGCEAALWLTRRGGRVALVERGTRLAARVSADLRSHLLWALDDAGVRVHTGTEATAIDTAGVSCRGASGEPAHLPAERIVLAAGAEAVAELWEEIEGRADKIFRIGDCYAPRGIRQALAEGHRAGTAI
ncbi:MAG: FAD-dependent oxidoreductase, partial [Acidobacteriota bacterium]